MGLISNKNKRGANDLNAFLGAGTQYKGKLDFVGTVRIDGDFEGEISTEGALVLGRDASIVGEVRVGELTMSGMIDGNVTVSGTARILSGARITGSLDAPVLIVEKGALIEGEIRMGLNGNGSKSALTERVEETTPEGE